jgi:hypothetical protein
VQMPPPPRVPLYRRCPADRQATDFTKELHPKTRATFVMPPPPPKTPGTLTWVLCTSGSANCTVLRGAMGGAIGIDPPATCSVHRVWR